jgi:hypothetical protein
MINSAKQSMAETSMDCFVVFAPRKKLRKLGHHAASAMG